MTQGRSHCERDDECSDVGRCVSNNENTSSSYLGIIPPMDQGISSVGVAHVTVEDPEDGVQVFLTGDPPRATVPHGRGTNLPTGPINSHDPQMAVWEATSTRHLKAECKRRAIDLVGCHDKQEILQRLRAAMEAISRPNVQTAELGAVMVSATCMDAVGIRAAEDARVKGNQLDPSWGYQQALPTTADRELPFEEVGGRAFPRPGSRLSENPHAATPSLTSSALAARAATGPWPAPPTSSETSSLAATVSASVASASCSTGVALLPGGTRDLFDEVLLEWGNDSEAKGGDSRSLEVHKPQLGPYRFSPVCAPQGHVRVEEECTATFWEAKPMRALRRECELRGINVAGCYTKCDMIRQLHASRHLLSRQETGITGLSPEQGSETTRRSHTLVASGAHGSPARYCQRSPGSQGPSDAVEPEAVGKYGPEGHIDDAPLLTTAQTEAAANGGALPHTEATSLRAACQTARASVSKSLGGVYDSITAACDVLSYEEDASTRAVCVWDGMTAKQLRQECWTRSVDLDGCLDKSDIIARLMQATQCCDALEGTGQTNLPGQDDSEVGLPERGQVGGRTPISGKPVGKATGQLSYDSFEMSKLLEGDPGTWQPSGSHPKAPEEDVGSGCAASLTVQKPIEGLVRLSTCGHESAEEYFAASASGVVEAKTPLDSTFAEFEPLVDIAAPDNNLGEAQGWVFTSAAMSRPQPNFTVRRMSLAELYKLSEPDLYDKCVTAGIDAASTDPKGVLISRLRQAYSKMAFAMVAPGSFPVASRSSSHGDQHKDVSTSSSVTAMSGIAVGSPRADPVTVGVPAPLMQNCTSTPSRSDHWRVPVAANPNTGLAAVPPRRCPFVATDATHEQDMVFHNLSPSASLAWSCRVRAVFDSYPGFTADLPPEAETWTDQELQLYFGSNGDFWPRGKRPSWIGRTWAAGSSTRPVHQVQISKRYPDLQEHFDKLGITDTTPHDCIRRRYRMLARDCHPDKHPDDPEAATIRFQAITAAYGAVKDRLQV